MKSKKTMKSRIKHAIDYEIFAIISISILMKPLFGFEVKSSVVLGVSFSLFAVIWNLVYNTIFDRINYHVTGNHNLSSIAQRLVHAIGFEATMVVITLPLLAWWKQLTILEAFKLEVFLIVFITIYTFVFNYLYDRRTEKAKEYSES